MYIWSKCSSKKNDYGKPNFIFIDFLSITREDRALLYFILNNNNFLVLILYIGYWTKQCMLLKLIFFRLDMDMLAVLNLIFIYEMKNIVDLIGKVFT